VWLLYEAIHNTSWGWSAYTPVKWSKYEAYDLAQVCDFILPNGNPRYTFNAYITEPMDGREFCRYMAGSFNSVIIDDQNGNVQVLMDKDDPAIAIIGPESVIGNIEYSYTDVNTRFNDMTVVFANPEIDYNEDRRRIFSQDQIDQHGRIPYDFIAVGCTNENEAVRKASRRLVSATTETEMATFKTNRIASYWKPYDIILITDPIKGYGLSGRFKSFTNNIVTLRDPIYLETGVSYGIDIQGLTGIVSRNIIVSEAGWTSTLTLSSALDTSVVNQKAQFSLKEGGGGYGLPKPYRILSIDENNGEADDYQVMAIEVNRLKFAAEDNAEIVGEPIYSFPKNKEPAAPTNVIVTNASRAAPDGTMLYAARVDFLKPRDPYVTGFFVRYRQTGETEYVVQEIDGSGFVLDLPREGSWEIQVQTRNLWNQQSPWVSPLVFPTLIGKQKPIFGGGIVSVEGFLNQIKVEVEFPQDQPDIRYAVIFGNQINSNATATELGKIDSTKFEHTGLSGVQTWYYWVKFEDNLGNRGDFTATAGFGATTKQATGDDIGDGVLSPDKFEVGFDPIQSVNELPSPGAYVGQTVFLLTDNTLYRWDGDSWEPLTGNLAENAGVEAVDSLPGGLGPADQGKVVLLKTDNKIYRWTGTQWISSTNATDIVGQIVEAQIANGALTASKFPSNVRPVEVLGALPSTGNTPGRQVYLTTDGKTYRWTGSAWTSTADVAAGAIDNTKFASGLQGVGVGASLPSLPNSAWPNGSQFVNTTNGKTYINRNGTWSADISASDIVGTVPASIPYGPTNPTTGSRDQLFHNTTDGKLYRWTGSGWTAEVASADIVGQIINTQIADAAVTIAKMTAGLTGIESVATLPSSGNFRGRTVMLQSDGKLYRWNSTTTTGTTNWVASVPAVDVTGQLTNAQIESVVANKVTGQLTSAQIESIVAGKITGQIVGTQISDSAISTPKLAANAVTADKITANAVTTVKLAAGAVEADKIATNAVTADKITANAVTSIKIAAGAIETDKLAANSVTTAKVAAGAITANELAANSVTANKVAAGAITTGALAAGAVTASKMFVGDMSNIVPDPQMVEVESWVTYTGWTFVPNGAPAGFRSVGYAQADTDAGTTGSLRTSFFSVEAGSQYFTAVQVDGTPNGGANLRIGYRDADNVETQAALGAIQTGDNTTQFTVPAGMKTAQLIITYSGSSAIKVGGFVVRRAASGELLVDGAVTAGKLAANSVVAGKVAADAITTNNIVAGAIQTAQLGAGAVTASKMFVGDTSNMVPDSAIVDPASWNFATSTVSIVTASPDSTSKNRFNVTPGTADVNVYSAWVPVEQGSELFFSAVMGYGSGTIGGGSYTYLQTGQDDGLGNVTSISNNAPTDPQNAATRAVFSQNIVVPTGHNVARIRFRRVTGGTATALFDSPIVRRRANGQLIVDGAIFANHLSTNSVTTGAIAAGAVKADQIDARAVTASKLFVGDTSNMIPDPMCVDPNSWSIAGNVSLAANPEGFSTNRYNFNAGAAVNDRIETGRFPVEAGRKYFASVRVHKDATTVANGVAVQIHWITKGNVGISVTTLFSGALTSSQTFETIGEAPANAAVASIRVLLTSGVTGGRVFVFDHIARKASSGELIVDGAVKANHLAVNSVTAGAISAGAVAATAIQAGAITSSKIYVGDLSNLIDSKFLANAITYSYNVGLTSLKVGINGDYTVKSSDDLYSNMVMQEKLLHAYTEKSLGKKTLIFNNGINTSLQVYESFKNAKYNIRHLDNTTSAEDRKDILQWFKKTNDAILTSVGILTTGFDEPTEETIILNRATKSLTLYFQMIGRGSRRLPNKDSFSVIDLGNNALRFGLWNNPIDWQHIFKSPEYYLESLREDAEIESNFKYVMPDELRKKFSKSTSQSSNTMRAEDTELSTIS
jgi:hypothetical protein